MGSALDDIVGDVTKQHVARRVDDWVRRLKALYGLFESWLPPGWTARRGRTVTMHEELMQKLSIGPRQVPTLDLEQNGTVRASVQPRALWVIGTNGRVDLRTPKGAFHIVDMAEHFEPPEWQVIPAIGRPKPRPLSREWLQSVL